MAGVKLKSSKPRWWKPLWIATLLLTTVSGAIGYLLLHVSIERAVSAVALTFVCIGIAYYIRVRPSMTVNRIVYVLGGIGIGWVMWVLYAVTGIGRWVTGTLGVWPSLIIGFAVFYTIGALIGDWIGRKRNYRLPLSP